MFLCFHQFCYCIVNSLTDILLHVVDNNNTLIKKKIMKHTGLVLMNPYVKVPILTVLRIYFNKHQNITQRRLHHSQIQVVCKKDNFVWGVLIRSGARHIENYAACHYYQTYYAVSRVARQKLSRLDVPYYYTKGMETTRFDGTHSASIKTRTQLVLYLLTFQGIVLLYTLKQSETRFVIKVILGLSSYLDI
ncbi:hypothetical protein AGLY_011718 [Aphis glycines]|uniref:Uncharacterized protein n=1 Tax=Aphis glycines TaxID=307491 RepID=A0A6G0TB70_APHGL|nr:hypothetical protein AGLY_011718 [Aphis glycines]